MILYTSIREITLSERIIRPKHFQNYPQPYPAVLNHFPPLKQQTLAPKSRKHCDTATYFRDI